MISPQSILRLTESRTLLRFRLTVAPFGVCFFPSTYVKACLHLITGWEAIRQAWPEFQVPEMQDLEKRSGQRIINEHRPPEYKHDNSLYAANISRNLLV